MGSLLIPVKLPSCHYDIVIAQHSLTQIGSEMALRGFKGKVLLISNPLIFKHYGSVVQDGLEAAGFSVSSCILVAGERYKTLRVLNRIYDAAFAAGLERSSTILALGGGVIGDMAGFAAATWLRGIRFVQVPTSLLAMVDASIGGKTGVNIPQGKNLIGAFYQPHLVWMDPSVLKTLPVREFRSGMAEVVKYGIIGSPEMVEFLEGLPRLNQYDAFSETDLQKMIAQAATCKVTVVQEDEKEAGLRATLNYGHTLGHALESATQYRRYLHGEAVALGMVAAAELSVQLAWWSETEAQRQNDLLKRCSLPVQWPNDISEETLLTIMQSDKKVVEGQVRFILPEKIGRVAITDAVTPDHIHHALQKIS